MRQTEPHRLEESRQPHHDPHDRSSSHARPSPSRSSPSVPHRFLGFLHERSLFTLFFSLTAFASVSILVILSVAPGRSTEDLAAHVPRTTFGISVDGVFRPAGGKGSQPVGFVDVELGAEPHRDVLVFEEAEAEPPRPYPALPDIPADELASLPKGCAEFILANSTKKPTAPPPSSTPPPYLQNPPQTIFFLHFFPALIHTRYLCAIESAAQVNPNHTLTIIAQNATSFEESLAPLRASLPRSVSARIHTRQLDLERYLTGTPLEPWYFNGVYLQYKEEWHKQNIGNAFRLALLWWEGGMYLDLDIISVNPISSLNRMIAKEVEGGLNNAALVFPPKDPFLWDLMNEFIANYHGNIW
ncbi:hypothetical protein BDK51DRAFT_38129 [Blyttiomyces helicus]|uniref:Nucleotide-diphospho-sugar transferase n=1 Tax=Blyttiomyces helicus TaxID=388810 RepID=A0A4P9W4G4_9FUNG|nr:hypothetical protein BDK51DRAFT_38129 [Blyttiomyces helicus]|eukprot:RKO85580.1 hypothetical protein BDK51DRAFT_38129 [Blyttiomyces helicus]